MKNVRLSILLLIIILTGCDNEHFINDKAYRKKVKEQFRITEDLAASRSDQLFGVFDQDLKLREKEALEFLYAYMSLNDLADYDGGFFLQNVRSSFAARDTFSWGKTIPEDVFRHFVLPVRVNNENLDSSRIIFFDEIKDRIRNMSMTDAALEVNHWCHEKVTYKASDARTSSPLASVKTAYGRCGEESTFTVAAMRAACIPARQCYTPRWAHTDDNHAWVEVWVDGKWHYMGACEPEPVLDLGWFSSHARRAMLVNTTVFGDYQGSEDVLRKEERFTQINVLPNYADTRRIVVKVTDGKNQPLDSAAVEFQLYNYAEFYPLTRTITDKSGICSFLTGYGDLLVWAAKNGGYGYRKASANDKDTLIISVGNPVKESYSVQLDFTPPAEQSVASKVTDSAREVNAKRCAFEDKVRENYVKTFMDSSKTYRLAATFGVNGDTLWEILKKSRGNYREIIDFITSAPDEKKQWVFALLLTISEKDLRDISPEMLFDQINSAGRTLAGMPEKELYVNYILNPRIDNEYLKPYQSFFQEAFEEDLMKKIMADPEVMVKWTSKNIVIDKKSNYSRASLTPRGVYELRVADPASRNIFLVAVLRSFGVPARLETATRIPQYYHSGKWVDVFFEKEISKSRERGNLILKRDPTANEINPQYYIHYTLEQLKDGFFRSLDYEYDPSIASFPVTLNVPNGDYLMVTGNRLPDRTVLANLTFFSMEPGGNNEMTVALRKQPAGKTLHIQTDPDKLLAKLAGIAATPGKGGTIIAWIEPEREPSRHFIADLIRLQPEFSKWNGSILLLFQDESQRQLFLEKNKGQLPKNSTSTTATGNLKSIFADLLEKDHSENLPVVVFMDSNGKIEYQSSGYRIGTGDDLLLLINKK